MVHNEIAWTNEEIKYLKENYKSGFTFCSVHLNKKSYLVQRKAKKLGLKLTKEDIHAINVRRRILKPDQYKVNCDQFSNVQTPEVAYILGLLWADGTIKTKCYVTRIGLTKDDFDCISYIFDKTGEWGSSLSNFHNRRPAIVRYTCNKLLWTYLYDNDYYIKSGASADKILSKIPDYLKHYWWLGYSDGDGCFSKSGANHIFQIASVIDQDWAFVEDLFQKLGISRYDIDQIIKKNGHRSSSIRINKAFDIEKFGNYIYSSYLNDRIGLLRKYNKFLLIENCADKLKKHNYLGELPYTIDIGLLDLDKSRLKNQKNGYKQRLVYDIIKHNNHISREQILNLTSLTKNEMCYCISSLRKANKIISHNTGKSQYYTVKNNL